MTLTDLISKVIESCPFVGILILLIVIDLASGTVAAFISKQLCSKISFQGVLKKFQIVLMVATGHVMELVYPEVPWGKIVAMFFCGYELLSIVENMGRAGLPLPLQLKVAMKALSQQMVDDEKKSHELNVRVEVKDADKRVDKT